ncbi:hypothetical protein B0H11DRAFT_2220936 [Mycena galericulata]|nr:hypothetical protein B0H11DRAFT_2220936 [Mycena galericulata]
MALKLKQLAPVGELDHVVRPKFKHLAVAGYRPFPFAELPVELALRILGYATGCSQRTYRSLLLTNKRISNLIRLEMLSGVAVILTSLRQLEAFAQYLAKRTEVIPHIHALWTIAPGSVRRFTVVSADIINTCTSIRSLACHPHVLEYALGRRQIGNQTLRHTRCVDLTLIEFRASWHNLMQYAALAQFFHQIERLHFIGALDAHLWSVFPKLNNLTRVSIAMGSHERISAPVFTEMLGSPKLQQVVVTTRLHGEDQQSLADAVQEIDDRFSVLHRRRRWKEANLWHESLQDPDRFWNQAKEEKYLPPAPRPTVAT